MTQSDTSLLSRATELRGLVDNFAEGRLFGWAWNPSRPGERLRIVLRRGRDTVAETLAAGERPDLRDAGIGDGRHAFDLLLPPGLGRRLSEVTLVACAADGTETPLPIRGTGRTRAVASPAASRAMPEEAIAEQLRTLEAWCLRLDERLATLGQAMQGKPAPKLDGWQIGLGAVLLVVALAAVAVAWLGAARVLG